MAESGENSIDKPISRRTFLKKSTVLAGVLAAEAVVGSAIVKSILDEDSRNKERLEALLSNEPPSSPESQDSTITEFGFNTHVHADTPEGDNHTLEMFKENVDQLAANNQDWIRFNIRTWEVAQPGEQTNSVLFDDNLSVYDEAIAYAKEKGLKIFLVTNVPEFAKEYSREDYKEVARDYYKKLAERYKGNIDIWQIFNEPDIHHFRDYAYNQELQRDVSYIDELAELVSIANSTIKEADPQALTTVNLSGYRTDLIEKGNFFFDHLSEIDILSLDLYPDVDLDEIERLPDYVEHFRKTYGKPVFIAELGFPTVGRFTEEDQAINVRASINSLKNGKMRPMAIVPYELTDETMAGGNAAQNHFGFERADGTPKKGLASVLEVMQKESPAPTTS